MQTTRHIAVLLPSHSARTRIYVLSGLTIARALFCNDPSVRHAHVEIKYKTRSLAVAKKPCDCCVGQFWPNVTEKRHFSGPEVLFKTCVAMKFVDDDDDDDDDDDFADI